MSKYIKIHQYFKMI